MSPSGMPDRLLVTGATGFVGRHLVAMHRDGRFPARELLLPPPGWDLRDTMAVADYIIGAKPTAVLHLAAQSFVPRAFEQPRETFEINLIGTLNLLQALKAEDFAGRFIYASSGDVYGLVPESKLPVNEEVMPAPGNPYAVSKVAAEQLCLQWHRSDGMDVMVARPFNHIGPGQDSRFVVPSMASQIIAIAEGKQAPVLDVGDIDSARDFTDVRDVIAAYAAMLQFGRSGKTYIVGSGREWRIRELLDLMCELAGVHAEYRQDPSRMRRADQRRMVADSTRLRMDTGWAPRIPIEITLKDILNCRGSNE